MRKLIFALALFSAFFVSNSHSFELDMSDLVDPNHRAGNIYQCVYSLSWGGNVNTTIDADTLADAMSSCSAWGISNINKSQPCGSTVATGISYGRFNLPTNLLKTDGTCVIGGQGGGTVTFTAKLQGTYETLECPPFEGSPHIHEVSDPNDPSTIKCAKELIQEPEPSDDDCDEFGNNSFLPPNDSLNVPSGGSVCYTTASGSKCKFKKNPFGSGFEQTGQQCTGEEPEYPKPDINPPDNPDNPNACAVVGSLDPHAVCPVNPNDVCNRIIVSGDGGDKIMNQCPAGCGAVDGQYVCAYPDSNGDGIPDQNQDPQKGSDTKDPNDPNNDSPDSTKTNTLLYGLDQKIGIGNSRLSGIKNGIDAMTSEQKKSNASLSAIASNTAKTANNTLSTAGSTADILTTLTETNVSNTFNPESSASFYESEYENGFAGVWEEKSSEFQQTEAYQFLQQFKFNGGGAAPDTSMCFNLGQFMDFGCSELPVPDAGLLAILKVFILISAAFLCRRLIFGG